MAITKTIENDKFEIVSEHKHLQVRTATVLTEDGVELSRTFSRRVLTPDMDISSESTEIQNICNAVWTDTVKSNWATFVSASEASLG
tara:strand:+ start:1035 stop:1295 length:261 start_codon:yes stop_codon:yes gene_type:complete